MTVLPGAMPVTRPPVTLATPDDDVAHVASDETSCEPPPSKLAVAVRCSEEPATTALPPEIATDTVAESSSSSPVQATTINTERKSALRIPRASPNAARRLAVAARAGAVALRAPHARQVGADANDRVI